MRALRAAALAAWLAVVLAVPARAASPADSAQRAYDAGQFARAAGLWHERAEHGDARAAYALSLLYDLGRGVERDPHAVLHWCRMAAEAGLPDAEFNMGALLADGVGTAPDAAGAALWFARAAVHGVARAAYNLGQLYAYGEGVPRNPSLAERWFGVAAVSLPAARRMVTARLPAAAPLGSRLTAARPRPVLREPGAGRVLVWDGPAEPVPVRYYVSVVALGGPPREVAGFFTDRSAAPVQLPDAAGRFAWRVYTVSAFARHYAASGWAVL